VRNDLDALRFSYEHRLLETLRSHLGVIPLIDFTQSRRLMESRRRDLLGDAARVTGDLLPEIHSAYRSALDMVGGRLSGDLYVQQSSFYNASVFAHAERFDILIHSALIRDFSIDELRFVFGHELGHVAFQHHLFPVREIIAEIGDRDPAATRLLLRYARATEVSADRVGLLCCGQLAPAATALFKTASGLTGIDVDRTLRSLHRQFSDLETQLKSAHDAAGWVRTHPMIPIRFKAMELSALDIVAIARIGFSERGFRQVDRQVGAILEALDHLAELDEGS